MIAANPQSRLWMAASDEALRNRVRILVTWHDMCGLRGNDACLVRHAPHRGNGLVLLVAAGLGEDDAGLAALRAMAAISPRAWRLAAEAMAGKRGA